jgi:hypothetical protein
MKRWLLPITLLAACATAPAPVVTAPAAGARAEPAFAWPAGTRLAVESELAQSRFGTRGRTTRTVRVHRILELRAGPHGPELASSAWTVDEPDEGWSSVALGLALEALAAPTLELDPSGRLTSFRPDDGARSVGERLLARVGRSLPRGEADRLLAVHFGADRLGSTATETWSLLIGGWADRSFPAEPASRERQLLAVRGFPPLAVDTESRFVGTAPCGPEEPAPCTILERSSHLAPEGLDLLAAAVGPRSTGRAHALEGRLDVVARFAGDPRTLLPRRIDHRTEVFVRFETPNPLDSLKTRAVFESHTSFRVLPPLDTAGTSR